MADNTHAMEQARAQFEHITEALERYDKDHSDEIIEELQEMPLSVEFRSGWQGYGEELKPEEFSILMCTGGPAVRIIGKIWDGVPSDAHIQGQDWGTYWESLPLAAYEQGQLMQFVALIIPQ